MISKRAQRGLENPYDSEINNGLFNTDPYHHEHNPAVSKFLCYNRHSLSRHS